MKVLTIKQPFAYLVASGEKDVENRTTRTNYRGEFLIHAGARPIPEIKDPKLYLPECEWYGIHESQHTMLDDMVAMNELRHPHRFDLGAIIGRAFLVDCVKGYHSPWAMEHYNGKDCWQWLIEGAELFEKPIGGIRGQLGFWNYNLDR